MNRTTWLLIVAAVLQAGALSAPQTLKANALAFVEAHTRDAAHRVACRRSPELVSPSSRRIIAI